MGIGVKPINLTEKVAKVGVTLSAECCADLPLDGEDITLKIKRAGACAYLIEYPVLEKKGDQAWFFLDALAYALPPGRYVGDVFVNGVVCGDIQFQKVKSAGVSKVEVVEFNHEVDCGS